MKGWKKWAVIVVLVVVGYYVLKKLLGRRVYDPSDSQQLSDLFDRLNPNIPAGSTKASGNPLVDNSTIADGPSPAPQDLPDQDVFGPRLPTGDLFTSGEA